MYVQKKLMAKLEQERLAADLSNAQQQQLDALKTFASLQQTNSAQQQLTAFLAAAMINKNFILNQQQQQLNSNTPVLNTNNKVNQSNSTTPKTNQASRKRSHSEIDAFSSSEEESYCNAKLRQPPSLGKINSSSKPSIHLDRLDTKLDQNNNAKSFFKETTVSIASLDKVKQYDSNHSDEEELDGKKNKRGRNYRKMMIEKRRRDRINNSLNELRRLVPAAFEKQQGSAKLEKAEILQMTVDHLKSLHSKGFDTFSFEPNKFALDYHTIGYNECVNEVVKYLTTNEDIDESVKQRVISHLKGHSNESKDGNNNVNSINLNDKANLVNSNRNKKTPNSTANKKQEASVIKQEQLTHNQHLNHNSTNLINLNSNNILPPSPNSDTLSSTSSSYVATSTSPNLSSESDAIYIPYALLKSKKISYNSTSVKQTNQLNNRLTNYQPDQTTLTNFNLNTLKTENSSNETKFIVDQVCRPWNQSLKCL